MHGDGNTHTQQQQQQQDDLNKEPCSTGSSQQLG